MIPVPPRPLAGLRVTSFHKLHQGGRWRTESMRSYASESLIWVTRGQGRVTVEGRTHGFGAHTLHCIPAKAMHGFALAAGGAGWVMRLPDDLQVAPWDRYSLHQFTDYRTQKELTGWFDQVDQELMDQRPGYERAARALCDLTLVWLSRHIEDPANQARPPAALRLAQAYAKLIEERFAEGPTVASLAEALHVTPTHLNRVCQSTCGRSAQTLLQDRTFFEARRLLSETTQSVGEIAAKLGFRSAAYFSRAFARETGQSPSAFRQVIGSVSVSA